MPRVVSGVSSRKPYYCWAGRSQPYCRAGCPVSFRAYPAAFPSPLRPPFSPFIPHFSSLSCLLSPCLLSPASCLLSPVSLSRSSLRPHFLPFFRLLSLFGHRSSVFAPPSPPFLAVFSRFIPHRSFLFPLSSSPLPPESGPKRAPSPMYVVKIDQIHSRRPPRGPLATP